MMRAAAFSAALALCACTQQAPPTDPRVEQFARLPNWSGIWLAEGLEPGVDGFSVSRPPTLAVQSPAIPWNESAMARLQAELATNPQLQVKPAAGWGYPLMMTSPTPFQVLITPEEVLIVNGYNETRHVYTDGRDHPAAEDLWPSATGNSVGHWEGQTLVIDTIMVTNPNEFFQGGPPLSEQAHYVERIRLDGDKLRAEMTIEDPVTLSAPWKARLAWVRDEGFDRMIQVDWNNDRTGTDGDVNTIEPPADERESQ